MIDINIDTEQKVLIVNNEDHHIVIDQYLYGFIHDIVDPWGWNKSPYEQMEPERRKGIDDALAATAADIHRLP